MRILLIDDDEDCLTAMKEMLRDEHKICTLKNAEDALSLLADRSLDLLILDDNLPGMSGREMLRLVKEQWPRLPVIMVSGYLNSEDEAELMAEGAGALFIKPLDVRSFLAKVAQLSQRE